MELQWPIVTAAWGLPIHALVPRGPSAAMGLLGPTGRRSWYLTSLTFGGCLSASGADVWSKEGLKGLKKNN